MLIHRDEYNRLLQKIKDHGTKPIQETKSNTDQNDSERNSNAENDTVESDNTMTEDKAYRTNQRKNENKKDLENIKPNLKRMKSLKGGNDSTHNQLSYNSSMRKVKGDITSKVRKHKNTGKNNKSKEIKKSKGAMTKKDINKKLVPPGIRYPYNKPITAASEKILKTKWLSV